MRPGFVAVSVVLALAAGTVFGRWSARLDPVPVSVVAPVSAVPSAGFLPGREGGDGAPSPTSVSGVVREVIQVPNYTYVRLDVEGGSEVWAAVETTTALTAGAPAVIANATLMRDFPSKALGRTFGEIYFGRVGGPGLR